MSLFDIDNVQTTPIKSTDWKWSFSDYPQEKNGLTVFSCFACGGGSTMGYKLAGCDVIGDLEIDPKMNEVYVKNHNPKYNYCMDIREFNKLDDLPEELYNLDILDGSPPCTTFSISGDREASWGKKKKFREGQAEQTLDDLSFVFIDTVEKLRPKVVIMENVEGIMLGTAYTYVLKIYQRFSEIGYQVKHWLIKGEEMGIPQKRHRVFFIAVRDDVEFDLTTINMDFNFVPVPFGLVADKDNYIEPSQIILNLLQSAVPNEDLALSDVLWRLENKCSRFNEKIVWDDLICPTVHSHGMYRGNDYSKLTHLDYLHCQTFPEDYDDLGQSISYICGMSVPPIMIKRVVTKLVEFGLFDYKNKDKNLL